MAVSYGGAVTDYYCDMHGWTEEPCYCDSVGCDCMENCIRTSWCECYECSKNCNCECL